MLFYNYFSREAVTSRMRTHYSDNRCVTEYFTFIDIYIYIYMYIKQSFF